MNIESDRNDPFHSLQMRQQTGTSVHILKTRKGITLRSRSTNGTKKLTITQVNSYKCISKNSNRKSGRPGRPGCEMDADSEDSKDSDYDPGSEKGSEDGLEGDAVSEGKGGAARADAHAKKMPISEKRKLRAGLSRLNLSTKHLDSVMDILCVYIVKQSDLTNAFRKEQKSKIIEKLECNILPRTARQERVKNSDYYAPGPGKGNPIKRDSRKGPTKRTQPTVEQDLVQPIQIPKKTLPDNLENPLASQAPSSDSPDDPAIQAQRRLALQSSSVSPTVICKHQINMNKYFRNAWVAKNKWQEARCVHAHIHTPSCENTHTHMYVL